MSEAVVAQHSTRTRSSRGQSFVEFALVLPLLLVLLLGIADFARVFQAGIVLEASSRNAAEVADREVAERARNRWRPNVLHGASPDRGGPSMRGIATPPDIRIPDPEGCPDSAHDAGSGATSSFVRVCVARRSRSGLSA